MGIAVDTASIRADFVEKAKNPHHVAYLGGMIRSSNASGDNLFPPGWEGPEVASDLQRTAARAELFTITKDMQELVLHASKSLPPQTIEPFDLPSQDGWLHLPVPFIIPDVRNNPIPIRTIMWSTRILSSAGSVPARLKGQQSGIMIYFFSNSDVNDPAFKGLPQDARENILLNSPQASVWGGLSVVFGEHSWSLVDTVDGSRENVDAIKGELQEQIDATVMESIHDFNVKSLDEDGFFVGETLAGGTVRAAPNQIVQFLKTYWHLCQSKITDLEQEELPRQFRRALQRKGLPTGPVSIVVLRKREYQSKGEGGGWELQYKYIRRSHWRRQPYGSAGAKYYRHILILPTVVGPDDAPWREGPVVNILAQ